MRAREAAKEQEAQDPEGQGACALPIDVFWSWGQAMMVCDGVPCRHGDVDHISKKKKTLLGRRFFPLLVFPSTLHSTTLLILFLFHNFATFIIRGRQWPARSPGMPRGRAMSVSSQASEASGDGVFEWHGSGVATPGPTPKPTAIEPALTKPQKYLRRDGVTIPATERSPLLPRRISTERNGHTYRADEALEQEWTWWDEFKTLSSYVLPVYGYVSPPFSFLKSLS